MKKTSVVIGLRTLMFCFLTGIGAGAAWGSNPTLSQSSCGSGCYTFTVSGLPDHSAGYSYYWFFDDGAYAITNVNTVNHTFQTFLGSGGSANRTVRVEVTRLYEKGDKPTSMTLNLTPGTAVTEPETVSTPLSIMPNRTPVPGDLVTYVVTYGKSCDGENPSKIELYYDPAEMTPVQADAKGFHLENLDFSTAGKVVVNLNGASFNLDAARRVFLPFEVKPEVQEYQTVGISGDIFYGINTQSCLGNPVTAYQDAQLSHDPNYIVANTPMVCGPVSNAQKLQYTIHFQNIGQAPAKTVEIRTWLPKFFSQTSVYQIPPYGGSPILLPVNNGEIVWTLSGPNLNDGKDLRGTGESGYGVKFFEEDTKDSIVYEVTFDPPQGTVFDPCQAVINRAEIVFDCNPSIYTNFYQTVIGCPTSVVGNCYCDTLSGTVISSDTLLFAGSLLPFDVSGTSPIGVVWYPPVFLTDPFSATPSAGPTRTIDYMASLRKTGCSYDLAHYRVEQNCDLSISAKVNYKKCKGGVIADIEAKAITSGSAANLVWNWECGSYKYDKNGAKFRLLDLEPKVYHLTVKDTQTGCWAETVVVVSGSCTKFPWKPVGIGAALVLAGLVIFFVLRKR
ncbi:MAG: hypothetical protein WA004_21275 [Saprospiraceae bacterium]